MSDDGWYTVRWIAFFACVIICVTIDTMPKIVRSWKGK